ncbi:MAG TPA: methylated-DNA--[protein]-cysteine S-methyltransferase [Bauldia sp.]|nr:methylated-DNA--[protein]-cysteine S-methyltransferase [Bauldia sp.]
MSANRFALFDTAIGNCGLAWNRKGVVALQLPEATRGATRDRLLRVCPGAQEAEPPEEIRRTIEAIAALLRGEARDLSAVVLDMDGVPPFHRRVYTVARAIPPGQTLTYGEVATRLGDPGAARAVGRALGRNPFPIIVPCHRVIASGGRLGGFSANGGAATKRRILEIEGVGKDAPRLPGIA